MPFFSLYLYVKTKLNKYLYNKLLNTYYIMVHKFRM